MLESSPKTDVALRKVPGSVSRRDEGQSSLFSSEDGKPHSGECEKSDIDLSESPRRGRWRRRSSSNSHSDNGRRDRKERGESSDYMGGDGPVDRVKHLLQQQQQHHRTFDLHSRIRRSPNIMTKKSSREKKKMTSTSTNPDSKLYSRESSTSERKPMYEFDLWKIDADEKTAKGPSEIERHAFDSTLASSIATEGSQSPRRLSSKPHPAPGAGRSLLRKAVSPKRTQTERTNGENSLKVSLPKDTPIERAKGIERTNVKTRSYKLGRVLGSGTFGKVFKALDCASGSMFVVKKMAVDGTSASQVSALCREVSLLQHLNHENIVRYLGTERRRHLLFIFLEFVPGGSVSSMLGEFGPFTEIVASRYASQILRGVSYLHSKKIVHRDIKGANVLVSPSGQVKLADFGCAKQLAGLRTNSLDESLRAIRGSVPWMAPEVIRQTGHSFEADMWSVGATVVEMVTAKHPWPPFDDNFSALFHIATANAPPPLPEGASDLLRGFLSRCFRIDPSERSSAIELLRDDFLEDCDARARVRYRKKL